MNLRILGDLSHFWQWDTSRKLVVDDFGVCNQVHYDNLVCEIKEENGIRVADVPNILLQSDEPITAYLYTYAENGSQTRHSFRFNVRARKRPDDYVYTETDVLNYAYLDERLKKLEGEGLAQAVADYLKDNPVQAGATAEEAAQIQQNKAEIEKIAKDKLDASALTEAVNEALTQAKESGEFKGEPGYTPVKGEDYFTEADKREIAEQAAQLVKIPEGDTVELDTTLTQSGKAADAKAVGDKLAEITGVSLVEPAEDDIPKVFVDGVIPTTSDYVLAEIRYISKTDTFHAYLEIKCQGRSSMSYAKKNFTIKMYSDEARETKLKKSFKDWGYEKNKYVLKANFVDHTHARNIVSARLWNEIVASRSDYDTLPEELRTSPRNGAIDGFPVKVYTNGTYQGIYTWNIGKDDWMWNMDEDNPNHFLLCGETNTNGKFAETPCNFRKLWSGGDGTDWTVEVGTNSTEVRTCLNNLIGFVMDNDGDAFREGIGNYLDVQSAIDYYILAYVICALDNLGSNVLLGTYDGKILRYGAYDLDSTFGNWYTGGSFVSADYKCPENYQEPFNLLFERIEVNFREELKARYAELRGSVLSFYNMVTHFERFMDVIGLDLYAEDATIYNIPNAKNKDIKQLRDYIRDRLAYTDAEFAAMIDPIPCTGISLSASTMTFTSEGTQTLTATVEPADTTDAVTWESNNISVATVSNGVVTAVANGSAVITARCGDFSASCAVSVSGIYEAVPCAGITLSATSIELNVDAESGMQGIHTLVATLTPEDTTDILSWNSSNPNVAKVEGGVVTAIAEGDATITATCGNYSASCSVTVSAQEVAPLYPLETGSYSFTKWETTVTLTTAENGHVKLDYSNNTLAEVVPLDNINTITNVKGYSKSSRTAPIFTFPAGSTVRMIVKNLAYATDDATGLQTSMFLWDSSKAEKKFFGNMADGATEADGTLTFEEEFPVYALALWQSKFIGTVEFDVELYVDGVRWI